MLRILPIFFVILVVLHGLIHFMGFVAYWPLAKLPDLPYKTTLLGGRWDVGAAGIRFYSLLWLLALLGFFAVGLVLAMRWSYWPWLMAGTAVLSLFICILDWKVAYGGAVLNLFLLLILFFVFGLRIQPDPFPPASVRPSYSTHLETVPLPAGLPAPLERYLRILYGDQLPLYDTAIISGRGSLRFMGISMPARLRFSHQDGSNYRHYIETTFYKIPVLKVNEHFIDGHSRLALPFGVIENDPKVDSAANQGLWGEISAYPAALVTNPSVRWEAVDDMTARLFVPFGEAEQVFTISFDPQTGLMTRMETLRYRDEKSGLLGWWGEYVYGTTADGRPIPRTFKVTWEDEGTPWLVAEIEDMVFNAPLSQYLRQTGP